jgi:membrane fusion protein (multidrug efflux system)
MIRRFALSILLLLLIVGGLVGIKVLQITTLIAGSKHAGPPPEAVASVLVREDQWQESLTAIGSIVPAQGVMITPELAGTVREIAFSSGAAVKQGDLLVRQDVSSEAAQLRAIQAQVELARLNLDRARKLRADNMNSQAEVDTADALLKQFQANGEAIQTTIEKKTIRAPFDGQLGIRQVNLGQHLDVGKPIVSLQALSPVFADFSLPQQQFARLTNGMTVRVTTDTYPGRVFEGQLTAINPDLDAATRSISLRATLANAEKLLRPGMFARVEVLLPGEQKVVVIPATALLSAPYGDIVYVIEPGTNQPPGLIVRQQLVRTGRTRNSFVSVEAGLKPGQKVAGSGVFKLRNGMAVVESSAAAAPANDSLPLEDN